MNRKDITEKDITEQVKDLRDSSFVYYMGGFPEVSKKLSQAANTIEVLSAKLSVANMERAKAYYGVGWILCSERLPTIEECLKNDCRFILDNGNRRYQGTFDYIEKRFVYSNWKGMRTDNCVIAWKLLPETCHHKRHRKVIEMVKQLMSGWKYKELY